MSLAPHLCAPCLAANRIAVVNGPTCPHGAASDAAWFPAWWEQASAEARRIAWLEARQKQEGSHV